MFKLDHLIVLKPFSYLRDMKYRLLSEDELEIFEEDLKHFLIANGIDGSEWEKINRTDEEKAIKLVELFSDVVLQKVYEKVKYIEHRSPSSCLVFNLNTDKIELISINAKSDEVDLSSPESIHKALGQRTSELTFFKSQKPYAKERELEIHEMLMQGCVNSSEAFWIMLNKAINEE